MRQSEYIYLISRPLREGERGRGRTGGEGEGEGGVNALTRKSTAEKDPYDFIDGGHSNVTSPASNRKTTSVLSSSFPSCL